MAEHVVEAAVPPRNPRQRRSPDERAAIYIGTRHQDSWSTLPSLSEAPTTVQGELAQRLALWEQLQDAHDAQRVDLQLLRHLGVYSGGQGIWVDKQRTGQLSPDGVAVSVLHTGVDYPDDLGENSMLYRYPHTRRPGRRDDSEITAAKRAAEFNIPIFVIAKITSTSHLRTVRLAWVEGWDDPSENFLISYAAQQPVRLFRRDTSDDEAFSLTRPARRQVTRNLRDRPDQARFKLRVFQRYGPRCPLTGLTVAPMLEAAHLCPVQHDGSDDPRNGLPLSASLHRAFDADLFAINPDTLTVETRPNGPSVSDLQIRHPSLADLPKRPHGDALRWRYDEWLKRVRG